MSSMRLPATHVRGAALLALVGLIGWVDWVSGVEVGLSLLYLVTVAAAAFRTNRWWTWGIVVACAASWLGAEILLRGGGISGAIFWNALTRLIIFSTAGWMLLELRADRSRLRQLNEQLRRALDAQTALARTDALTGLANGRSFREELEARLATSSPEGLCLAYIDVDNFKKLNDIYGHATGDEALRRIAEIIRGAMRVDDAVHAPDFAARIGGDEFVLVFHGVDPEQGARIADRIISRVEALATEFSEAGLGISIGLSCARGGETDGEALVRRADDAMYTAKARGKGRYAVAGPPPVG